MTNIAVTSAASSQMTPVVRALRATGHRVRALHRPQGRVLAAWDEAAPADLLEPDSLVRALDGVQAAVVGLPLEFEAGAARRQAENLLLAVQKTGVGRVVLNTGTPLPPTAVGVPFLDTRRWLADELAASGAVTAVVHPAATYLENLVAPWSLPLLREGVLEYPLPAEAPIPWVAGSDLADVVVELVDAERPARLTVVAGPEDLQGLQLARALSAGMGREVEWQTISPARYEQLLRPHLGERAAAGVAGAYAETGPPPALPEDAALVRGRTSATGWVRQALAGSDG
ncbi:SDR family oxidoreductase [Motilibacter aurantiacus]|uniref:SDR family oxidoreductase n=1 Tax=Motilibacter aurantiacus TaxID=2714955 RepID=UPI00140847F5|nr:NmrA family NAD(P)-binding protein [Motilibacter aurantiacus]NHC46731.1 NmrA family NAD(P)-binding protein [Motilibacter aurantiacus]